MEVLSIHDDIFKCDISDENYDCNLINPINMVQLEGLVLKSKKFKLKRPKVSFFRTQL